MGKKFISAQAVEGFINRGDNTLYMDKEMILSSGAKDVLRSKGVAIVYGEKTPENLESASTTQDLISRVVGILKDEYKISDPDQLLAVSTTVLERMQKRN